jgi:NitT/TauT family transport system ATP-binding protein
MDAAAMSADEACAGAKGLLVQGVEKSYGPAHAPKHVVRACSFTAEPGKLTVMIGPSGCGKSALVRILAGFERPSAGRIALDGREVSAPSHERLVLFQESALFPWMSTYENVVYGPRARGELTQDTRARAEALLDRVGLRAFRDAYPNQLSGGMQRRAELARALINEPKLMMLDEPFRGLDAMTKDLMAQYYAGLVEGAARVDLFVTTDLDEAVFLADRLLIMTALPMRVRAVIEVDLPRPRALADVARSERAAAIKREALALLHEEALKAFGGSRRAAIASGATPAR